MEALGIIALLCAFIWWRVRAGDTLAPVGNKFVAMGNISGWPIEKIVRRVGRPNSISATADGKLYQWIKMGTFGGYHYAISVDCDGKAIGYTHQFSR